MLCSVSVYQFHLLISSYNRNHHPYVPRSTDHPVRFQTDLFHFRLSEQQQGDKIQHNYTADIPPWHLLQAHFVLSVTFTIYLLCDSIFGKVIDIGIILITIYCIFIDQWMPQMILYAQALLFLQVQ